MTRVPQPLYLVRHGQSEWNVLELTQGQTTHPRLTPLGREQSALAAARLLADLGERKVGSIVSSDLVRATETAEIIASIVGGTVTPDVRLREQHLGDLEGRTYAVTWAAAEAHDWTDPDLRVAGGESPRHVRDRMVDLIGSLDRSVVTVLVSHGDAIRAAVAHLSGFPPNGAPWVEVPNGAVARVGDGGPSWLGSSYGARPANDP